MEVLAHKVITTDEELREEIIRGAYVDLDAIWVKLPTDYKPIAPIADKDGEVEEKLSAVKDETNYYTEKVADKTYMVVGRSAKTPNGKPTGNFQKLAEAEFKEWVAELPIENFCLKPPEVVEEKEIEKVIEVIEVKR